MTQSLTAHAARLDAVSLADLAAQRAGQPPLKAAGWQIDMARQRLDSEAEAALIAHGEAAGLATAVNALFSGEIVNPSENRPALHWALRAQAPLEGEAETARRSMDKPLAFAGDVRAGRVTGSTGKAFTSIVHIGIGGSDFGPRLFADAFFKERDRSIELRFCANLDPLDLDLALDGLDPEQTLVIGVSKSFGTEETLYNLSRARDWLKASLGADWPAHLALVTANPAKATAWLDGQDGHLFDMPLAVGGRFSIWSAGSLACFISLGPDLSRDFLRGAADMDAHVKSASITENAAMRLALLDYWNATVRGAPMRVQLAYARRLRMLPTYLQQLEMESNGKTVGPDGTAIEGSTAPALWGGEGSIGQHSYHQWLHQGAQAVPTEFILALEPGGDPAGKTALTAHALAQAEVLANGRSLAEVNAEEPELTDAVAAQKVHLGGRPSTVLTTLNFDAAAFGALVALFEHRTYLAGMLWGVNPFDQWGVERGKTMASRVKAALQGEAAAEDPETGALVERLTR
ncbi:MAG: glucose-6-phosphate isomerase [Pseudomonadota bacterium]